MPTFPAPLGGVDKHRQIAYIEVTIGSETRRFYAYTRATYTGSIDLRENTNAASSVTQQQIMREDTPTFDVEVNIPYDLTQAKDSINFLRAGRILAGFDVKNRDNTGVFEAGYLAQYGSYIIERSSIDISRDDFTTVRATIRGLGYSRAHNLDPVQMPV